MVYLAEVYSLKKKRTKEIKAPLLKWMHIWDHWKGEYDLCSDSVQKTCQRRCPVCTTKQQIPPLDKKVNKILTQNYKEKSFLDPYTCSQDRALWTHSVTGSESLPLGFNPRIWFGFPVFPQFPPTVTEYKNSLHCNTLSFHPLFFFPGGLSLADFGTWRNFSDGLDDIFWFLLTTHHFCVQPVLISSTFSPLYLEWQMWFGRQPAEDCCTARHW